MYFLRQRSFLKRPALSIALPVFSHILHRFIQRFHVEKLINVARKIQAVFLPEAL